MATCSEMSCLFHYLFPFMAIMVEGKTRLLSTYIYTYSRAPSRMAYPRAPSRMAYIYILWPYILILYYPCHCIYNALGSHKNLLPRVMFMYMITRHLVWHIYIYFGLISLSYTILAIVYIML
jgi:hypothetical protein